MDYYNVKIEWQSTQSTGNDAWDKLVREAREKSAATQYDALDPFSSQMASTSSPILSPGTAARPHYTKSAIWSSIGFPSAPPTHTRPSLAPRTKTLYSYKPESPPDVKSIVDGLSRLIDADQARSRSAAASDFSRTAEKLASAARTTDDDDVPTQPLSNPLYDRKGKGKGKEKAYVLTPVMDMSMEDMYIEDVLSIPDTRPGTSHNRSGPAFSSPRARSASTSSHQAPSLATSSSRGKLQRHTSHPCSSTLFSSVIDDPFEDLVPTEPVYPKHDSLERQFQNHAVRRNTPAASSHQSSYVPTQPVYSRREPSTVDLQRQSQHSIPKRSANVAPPKPTVRMHPLLIQQSQAQAQALEAKPTPLPKAADRTVLPAQPQPGNSSSVYKTANQAHRNVPQQAGSSTSGRNFSRVAFTSSIRSPAIGPQRVSGRTSSTTQQRRPMLGMRRTQTSPTSPFQNRSGAPSEQNLPTRQRSFKPPLGGAGVRPRRPDPARLKAIEEGIKEAKAASQKSQVHNNQPAQEAPRAPVGSQGSTTSSGSNTSGTSKSRYSMSTTNSSVGETKYERVANSKNKKPEKVNNTRSGEYDDMDIDIPGPADGDPDSSFGDISLDVDVDALEATMKMYD